MSVVFSGTWSDTFTSTGVARFIPLPAGVDWMEVRNENVLNAPTAGSGGVFYWRKNTTQGRGTVETVTGGFGNALVPSQIAANLGFFWLDTTLNTLGASTALTGINNALPPLVTTGNTAGLTANASIVRIYSTVGALQVGGMDFTVGTIVNNVSFTLAHMPAIANAAPGAGTFRIVSFVPYFYPSTRQITKISQAAQAIVTLSVNHSYVVGQKIRFSIPTVTATAFGMTALNGVEATIVAVNATDGTSTNTITVDVDTTAMTAFALPLTTAPGFTPAMVIPTAENMASALSFGTNTLADAVYNGGATGLLLMPGVTGPAGVNGDVITWIAGKSFNK
jgi:hypothetical protein